MIKNHSSRITRVITEQDWARINQEWEKDREPQKQFCKRHNISYAKFAGWRHRNNQTQAKGNTYKTNSFQAVKISNNEVGISNKSQQSIKINMPGNICITIPTDISEQALALVFKLFRGLNHA